MESARRATPDDRARVSELAEVARSEIGSQVRGGTVFVNREVLADPFAAGVLVVGEYDGAVVGYGSGRTEELRNGTRLGVVDEVFVEGEARGVGIGEAMLGELLAWFRSEGCVGVDAYALPGMRETKNFFETFGFTARLLVVHHRLEGADSAVGDDAEA